MSLSTPRKKLGELFSFKNGRAFKKEEWGTQGLPIIRIQNLNNESAPFNYFAGEYSPDILVESGDLLFSWSGTVGSSFGSHLWTREKGVLNQHIFKIGIRGDIDKRYAFYALDFITEEIEHSVSGAVGLVHITKEKLNEFTIPVPSLLEQQRIVELLDEALASLANVQANSEKNLQNASAIFEAHLRSTFTHRGTGWVERTLGEIATIKGGKRVPKGYKLESNPTGFPYLRVTDFDDAGTIDMSNLRYVSKEVQPEIKNYIIRPDDLYISIAGTIGKTGIIPRELDGANLTENACRLIFHSGFSNRYVYYFTTTRDFIDQAGVNTRTAAQPKLALSRLATIRLSIPTFEEQSSLVESFDKLHAETQRLSQIYERKLTALEELKKSLLHRAFTGELTQDWRESKIIAFPVAIPSIKATDLHAGILAIAYRCHERHGKQAEFGHVKGEKIIHLVEALVGIDLGRAPVKDAAGPNDFPHLQKVEHRARMAEYFRFQRVEGAAYRVTKLPKFDELIKRTENALGERATEVEKLLDTMRTMNTRQAEIFATVFAAWNNLLLDGKDPCDEAIVLEARENWHPDKLKIPREKFFAAITWMRDHDLAPKGRGKRVGEKVVRKK